MVLRNSHALLLPMVSLVPHLLHNSMGRCVALRTIRSIRRPGVPSAMALCGSCMLHALAIAAPGLLPHAVSRERHHPETATGERGALAALLFILGYLASF